MDNKALREEWKAINARAETNVIPLGQSALQSAMLINGGAAVALLGFVSSAEGPAMAFFAAALTAFGVGVVLVTMAYGATYAAQHCYVWSETLYLNPALDAEAKFYRKIGIWLHGAVVLLFLCSIAAFSIGAWEARTGFLARSAPPRAPIAAALPGRP